MKATKLEDPALGVMQALASARGLYDPTGVEVGSAIANAINSKNNHGVASKGVQLMTPQKMLSSGENVLYFVRLPKMFRSLTYCTRKLY